MDSRDHSRSARSGDYGLRHLRASCRHHITCPFLASAREEVPFTGARFGTRPAHGPQRPRNHAPRSGLLPQRSSKEVPDRLKALAYQRCTTRNLNPWRGEVAKISQRGLSARTIDGFRYHLSKYLADWRTVPLTELRRSMCRDRHRKITDRHGPYPANQVMRSLRAAWNFALRVVDDPESEPSTSGAAFTGG